MNQRKGAISRAARFVRDGIKKSGTILAGKIFGRRSFTLFGVPSGLTSAERNGDVTFFYQPVTMPMQPPKTIEPELFWNYRQILEGIPQLPAEGILFVPKGIATSKGGNLSSQGKLITTFLQPIDCKSPHQHDLLRFSTKKFFPSLYTSKNPVVTLAAGRQEAFYHWVYEVLPRLHLVEKGGYAQECLYVEAATAFQKQSLELMGVKPSQIINAHTYSALQAPQLIVPSISEIPTHWGCEYLRQKIVPQLCKKPPLRLYVSRSDALRRRILNESEVFAVLKRYGFEKVELSALTFKEQAEFFLAAEAVVGPHGAGFSHLVFCQPKTPFLEIFDPAYFNPCYWYVSDRVGLEYYYQFGEGPRFPDGFQTHLDPDITVNLGQLEASLKLMGL